MYYTYITAACPKCKRMLYFKFTKLMWLIRVTSGLGPNYVICSNCNTKSLTSNKEWQQMSAGEKLWYIILSVFYGVVFGLLTSMTVGVIVHRTFGFVFSTELVWLFIIAPITLLVLAIQVFRILLSLERTEQDRESTKVVSFWDWETNLQSYGVMWIILSMLGTVPFLFF